MFNKNHVYNIFILTLIFFSFLNNEINSKKKGSSYKYDYFNILDKGPKAELNYIFNNNNNKNTNFKDLNTEKYTRIVDETFPSYQSLFFSDLETITPLYDQTIECKFPIKKNISFNNDLYINKNFFDNETKLKIIPTDYAKVLLKPTMNICYNYFIDRWYYKLCPFNKAVQTLSFLKKNPKTGKEEKEVNYLGYASNDTNNNFNELEYFYSTSPYNENFFEKNEYKFLNKSQIVGTFQNVVKIFNPPDNQNEFKIINEDNKNNNQVLPDYLMYKYQFKILEIDYEVSQLEKINDISKYKVNKRYKNLDDFKSDNKSNIITYEREIKKAINKNLFLLGENLPPVQSGIINTRIKTFSFYQEDYYNKEFFIEKNLLYCEHCNLLKCQSNNCFLTLSKDKENYFKIIDFLDEKLVVLDETIDKTISHKSKFALFINDDYIFFFGKGKIEEIKRSKEVSSNENKEENNIFIMNGKKLNLKEGENILLLVKQVKKNEYYIIKDIHNQKLYLLGLVNKKINETHYEILINNITTSPYANSTILHIGEKFFKVKKRADIKEQKGDVQIINKSKKIKFDSNAKNDLFNIQHISQITIPRNNLNIDLPYQIFDLNKKNNQSDFHFVVKKMSQWKESYINICLSENETCNENNIEIIIHSKKGILIHRPKLSSEKNINDSLLFYSNDVINLFTQKIICDIVFINSSLYFNVIDYNQYSYIRLKYILPKDEFDKIKYAVISPMKSMNIKIKGIYVTHIISMKLLFNIYFYDKQYLLDEKAVFMETFTNGDYCPVIKKPRTVKVFYMCDESGINNLKIVKVHEAKNKLCEYIYYVKSKLLCNPNNIMKSQVNTSFSKSLCYSDKTFE